MRRWLACSLVTVSLSSLLGALFFVRAAAAPAKDPEPQLAHMVFFTLAEDTEAAREKLVGACKKYLSDHEGTVYFSAGTIAEDLDREVNDRRFDVALHIVFRNRAAHDKYQTHPRHLAFIEENKALWKEVRVFDSNVRPEKPEQRKQASVPRAAHGFAGMVRAKVLARQGQRVSVRIEDIAEVWETNKAEDPKALAGKEVVVRGAKEKESPVARFLRLLEPGETVTLDVAHRQGGVLTVLELTEEQRARVESAD